MGHSGLWIPRTLKPAVKRVNIVFYQHITSGKIFVGAPEEFPAPNGCRKIVCTTAKEVELWSQKIRDQEKREAEMTEQQREAVEAPLRAYARAELVTLMLNARDDFNRDFCRAALQKMDEDEARRKFKRESWMHVEAAEDGH